MKKTKILILVDEYPQISQTYIKNEIEGLVEKNYEIEILARKVGSYPFRSRNPHLIISKENQQHVLEYLKSYKPDFIHAHYMILLPLASQLADLLRCPFTVRAHSFDTSPRILSKINFDKILGDKNLRGILSFPYSSQKLIDIGFSRDKIIDCPPVVDVKKFMNTATNGPDILNVGAPIPKKNVEDYIRLSKFVDNRKFDYLGTGYHVGEYIKLNNEINGKVNFLRPVDPDDMPNVYKKYTYLVYTASRDINQVGWPMALIEAMASGVQVYMQGIRDDIKDFLGPSGVLFQSIEDISSSLNAPPDQKKILEGFDWVQQFDYRKHLHLLTNLW